MKVYVRVFGRLQVYIVEGENDPSQARRAVVEHLNAAGLINFHPVLAVVHGGKE